jgi:hypothetical protein
MEGESRELPLKVCPHCSVASRTDSETCPNCGKSYVRGGPSLRWSWWFAIPIVAAAFLIGYFGISQLIDGDESDGITVEEASSIEIGNTTRAELTERLGEPESETTIGGGQVCLDYVVTDGEDPEWLFCFRGDQLESSAPLPE